MFLASEARGLSYRSLRKEERSSSGKKFIRVIKLNLFGTGLCYFVPFRDSLENFGEWERVGVAFYSLLVGRCVGISF